MNFPKGKWIELLSNQVTEIKFPVELEFSGVYIFYRENIVLYIGSSGNIRSRIITHLYAHQKTLAGIDNLRIKVRKNKFKFEHLTLEAKLIYRLRPMNNKKIPNGHTKKEQKEEIKQDITSLTERLKPVHSGENKRLNHIDKDLGLNQPE